MDKQTLEKIVSVVTKECKKNFEKHITKEYTLAKLEVIPFTSKEISTRKVSDWGTDEDCDEYVWYSHEGWQHANLTVQTGAGVQKVVEKNICTISEQQVVEVLLKWNLFQQMNFINNAFSVLYLSEYKSELYI